MIVGISLQKKHFLKYLAGLAAVASIAVALIFLVNAAHAAISIDKATKENALSYTSYQALSGCAGKRLYSTIATQPSNPRATDPLSWYGPDIDSGNSYIYPSGKQANCGDILKGVASLWGISDYGKFLTDIGYKFNESVPEYKWSGSDADRKTAFNNAVKSKVVNGSRVDNLPDPTKYAIYVSSLEGDCKGTDVGAYTSTFKSYADSGKRDGDYIYAKVVTSSGDRVYKRLYGKDLIMYGYMSSTSTAAGALRGVDCGTINDTVNATAKAYVTQEARGLCKDTGPKYTESSLINACANGASNKSSGITYCKDAYRGVYSAGGGSDQKAEREACYVGQGNAGGGKCVDIGYAATDVLQACVNGVKNRTNTNYCNNTYPAPDSLNASGSLPRDTNAEKREACKAGQTLAVDANIDTPITACADGDASCAAPTEGGSSCVIEGVGWIVCPVVNFLANIADGAFGFLADSFLRTDPSAFNNDTPAYKAWVIMRNVANVLFVIVFLFIIFSQITGTGISNYGVKKMLPRLVVAAILVNISFVISQLAVDLSNILGYSIRDVFDGISEQVRGDTYADVASAAATGNSFTDIAVGILAFGGAAIALYALLSTFGAIVLAAVLALLMILFILIARQAIVILLVVLSPIAFVAFLLPNTENLFKFWRKTLTAMLLLFPIIALVFGASSLASTVLQGSFTGAYNQEGSNWFGQIIASAVLVIPLFVVPILLKKSLDGVPMIGQMANKWSSKANSKLGGAVGNSYKGSKFGRGRAVRRAAREEFRNQKYAQSLTQGGKKGAVAQFTAGGVSSLGLGLTKNQREMQKAQRSAVTSSARSTVANAEAKDLGDAMKVLDQDIATAQVKQGASFSKDDYLMSVATSATASDTQKSAAMHQLTALGRDKQVRQLQTQFRAAGDTHSEENLNRAISANAGALVSKAPDLIKGGDGPAFQNITGEQLAGYSEDTARQHAAYLEKLYSQSQDASLSKTDRDKAVKEFNTAYTSYSAAVRDVKNTPTLQAKFGREVGNKYAEVFSGSTHAGFGAYKPADIGADGKIR